LWIAPYSLTQQEVVPELARIFNPIIQGWINYYGRFYRSVLVKALRRINAYLVRWGMANYKRLRRYPAEARRFLVDVVRRQPGLFAHWRFGVRPDGWRMGARGVERLTPGSERAGGCDLPRPLARSCASARRVGRRLLAKRTELGSS
jgi:hypothetical protein